MLNAGPFDPCGEPGAELLGQLRRDVAAEAGPYNSVYLPASGYGPVSPRRWNSSKALILVIFNALRFASSNPHRLKVASQAGIDRSTFHSPPEAFLI